MRTFLTTLSLVAALVAGASAQQSGGQQPPPPTPPPAPAPKTADVAGKWTMTLEMSMGQATTALAFKQEADKITGTYTGRYGTYELKGTVKAREIAFAFTMSADGTPVEMSFTGEIAADGQTMKGQAVLGELGEAGWSAKRDKK
jgi:hypothetical protein